FYQPRIDLRSGKMVGAEALIRWQHPKRGLLPPSELLPVIHNTPLEVRLDEWVLKRALDQHMAFREHGLLVPLSVNVTPQSIQKQSFVGFLQELLSAYPSDIAEHLEIEILETAAIENTARVAQTMDACAELGIRFSLDDFGTGYSSLTHFHRLPISVLKIDQQFVRKLISEAQDHDIVEGVLLLARALGRPVVAEGVENIEIALLLHQLGCQYAQGYGIARPMPAEQLESWNASWESGSFSDELREYSKGPFEHHDLKTVFFAHDRWMQNLRRYVDSGCRIEPPPLDPLDCKFGAWCEGVGKRRFSDRPFFHRVLHVHANLHNAAQGLVELSKNAGVGDVEARMRDIEHESYQLETLLLALDRDIR
ncbi:MAG: EAL domain-containing protein, partial [Halieaceae bacterium]|nr:EAL domain-containing protein [Halieaceae bacterium]